VLYTFGCCRQRRRGEHEYEDGRKRSRTRPVPAPGNPEPHPVPKKFERTTLRFRISKAPGTQPYPAPPRIMRAAAADRAASTWRQRNYSRSGHSRLWSYRIDFRRCSLTQSAEDCAAAFSAADRNCRVGIEGLQGPVWSLEGTWMSRHCRTPDGRRASLPAVTAIGLCPSDGRPFPRQRPSVR
jgi:hypothetical protein